MYKLTNFTTILRADGASIPADFANVDYAAYLDWLDAGNTPELADPIAVHIAPISPRQIRMALTRAGIRDAVELAVAAGDQDLKDWYEYSTIFERENEQVSAMGYALSQTSEQLDALWALGLSL